MTDSDRGSDLPTRIGRAVVAARKDLGLDQVTAAALAEVSPRFLREVEHGKRTVRLSHLLAVLDAVGLRLELADDHD